MNGSRIAGPGQFLKLAKLTCEYRLFLSLFFFVLGLRMWAHSYAGGPVPFYDQWFFGFNNLAIFPTTRHLTFLRLSHNEHRLITTEFIELFGLWWNGYYDVHVTLICGAVVRGLNAVLAFYLLRGQTKETRFWAWIGCFFVFGIPYSGYNALNGMQVSMYLADFSMLASLLLIQKWPSTYAWGFPVLLVSASAFGLLSFSQAVLIPLATLLAHLFSKRNRPGFWPVWAITIFLSGLLCYCSPDGYPWRFPNLIAVLAVVAWPVRLSFFGTALAIIASFLLIETFLRKKSLPPHLCGVWAIFAYSTSAALLLAFKRLDSFNMRHFESLAPVGFSIICITYNCSYKWLRRFSFVLLICLGFAWTSPLVQTWHYYQCNHRFKDDAVKITRIMLQQGEIQEYGDLVIKKLAVHDYSFFMVPILK